MSDPLRSARIGLLTASASRLGGGVFEAVVAQVEVLRRIGAEPVVLALDDSFAAEDEARLGGAQVVRASVCGPRQIGYAPDLPALLLAADLDCLHLHGIWMYPSRAATLWARATGRPYLISPHGMLDPWITGRGRWKKTLARWGYERSSWRTATAFHALTGREAVDIARETSRQDSLVIANAGPSLVPARTSPPGANVLFISRIHPKKNLAALLAAWRDLCATGDAPAGATLTIAGWGDPADVRTFENELALGPASVRFAGPCFGAMKDRELSRARFVILPSLSEGLPMTLLEAWAAGIPTLQSAGCNLPEAFAAGAALDCGTSFQTIRACLHEALAMPDQRWLAMAAAARGLAESCFSRDRIAGCWAETYARLLGGERP